MSSKNITIAIVLLALFCGAYSQQLNLDKTKNITIKQLTSYNKWRTSNKRNYLNDDEKLFRQLIFFENLNKIEEHNSNPSNTYTVSTNQFSDMTQEEFVSKVLNNNLFDKNQNNLENDSPVLYAGQTVSNAASIDWRTSGAVTPVKDQGNCGSCWSFSTTGVMESFNFIQNGVLKSFSEQQIVDCAIQANGYYSFGCNGGSVYSGLSYAKKYGALDSSAYPYVAVQGTCQTTSITTGFKPKTFIQVQNTVDALKTALNKSPVAIAVDASTFSNYQSGIFNGCGSTINLNHAILAVGYDAQGNWIVKNSWSTWWGEQGYMRLAAGNTCGILGYNYQITS